LKWKWQLEKRTRGWLSTLLTQRAELHRLLQDSPSLRRAIATAGAKVYPVVRESAVLETGQAATALPGVYPFTADQMDRDFLPE